MKRELSPSQSADGAPPKKSKDESDQGPPDDISPPPNLQMSVLIWKGEPTTYDVEGNDLLDYVGAYVCAASSSLIYTGWDNVHQALQYAPSSGPVAFDYERHAFIGTASSQITYYGGIIADDMSPKVRVCGTNEKPWPEMFGEDLDMVK